MTSKKVNWYSKGFSKFTTQSPSAASQVDRGFAWFGDGFKWVARPFFRNDPFLLVGDNFEQQVLVFGGRHELCEVLLVFLVFHRLAALGMTFLVRPLPYHPIKFNVWGVEPGFAGFQNAVEALDQA